MLPSAQLGCWAQSQNKSALQAKGTCSTFDTSTKGSRYREGVIGQRNAAAAKSQSRSAGNTPMRTHPARPPQATAPPRRGRHHHHHHHAAGSGRGADLSVARLPAPPPLMTPTLPDLPPRNARQPSPHQTVTPLSSAAPRRRRRAAASVDDHEAGQGLVLQGAASRGAAP